MKMNPLHLIWIIPLTLAVGGSLGFLFAALLIVADTADDEKEYSGLLEED